MSRRDWLRERATECSLQIAIDGPAGAGKSTVGRGLANVLACRYLDTGLMYRALTWVALDQQVSVTDARALEGLARDSRFALGDDGTSLWFNGVLAGSYLRSPRVDAAVSAVAAVPGVREQMVRRQRDLARAGCIVMVGRDIGTIVLPDAAVKLWVTASAAERARRRLAEQLPGSAGVGEAEMISRIELRDAQDAGRPVAPLRRPPDALDIVTDAAGPEESVRTAVQAVDRYLSERGCGLAAQAIESDRSS